MFRCRGRQFAMSDGSKHRATALSAHKPRSPSPPPKSTEGHHDGRKDGTKEVGHGETPANPSVQSVKAQSHHSQHRGSPSSAKIATGSRGLSKARGTRSANMILDLLEDDAESPQKGVPKWLVEEQRHHQRRPQPESSVNPPAARRGGESEKPQGSSTNTNTNGKSDKEHAEEEYIMLDLLDAAHLPSKNADSAEEAAKTQPTGTMSTSTDSIISLPPMEETTGQTRWHKLKAEAQEARKKARQASLTGRSSKPPMPHHGKSPSIDAANLPVLSDVVVDDVDIGLQPHQSSPVPPSMASPPDSRLKAKPLTVGDLVSSNTSREQQRTAKASMVVQDDLSDLTRHTPASNDLQPLFDRPEDGALRSATPYNASLRGSSPEDVPSPLAAGDNHANRLVIHPSIDSSDSGFVLQDAEDIHKESRDSQGVIGDQEKGSVLASTSSKGSLNEPEGSKGESTASVVESTAASRSAQSNSENVLQQSEESPLHKLFFGRRQDDSVSISSSRSHGGASRSGRHGGKRRQKRNKREAVYPHSWEWRRPADEDVIIPNGAWIYLALIGFCSFACACFVNVSASFLSVNVTGFMADIGGSVFGDRGRVLALAGIRAAFLVTSFLFVSRISPKCTSGSGIPEMKCVLSGVYMPHALGVRTLLGKLVGLVFALSSSISIGRLGPFIHVSGICAALIARLPPFSVLSSSARFQLQAVSCAMAAGVGATFGAPIGGTMLSIELMSTYYFIHWLPMALYCSIMGYYLISAFSPTDAQAYFYASVSIGLQNKSVYKLMTFAVLGAICGLVGAMLVKYTVFMFKLRRRFLRSDMILGSCVVLAAFAAVHSLTLSHLGGVLEAGQRAGVIELFNDKAAGDTTKWMKHSLSPFSRSDWNASFTLFVAMVVKFCLTGIALVLPVPAGTFMPIFEIGALLGRSFGEFWSNFSFITWIDPRATAIVGAAGVAAGTLHTTSIAVVMLEITREAVDILPLSLGVIVAYGVSKHLCSDLFSELIKIRRMPFILGLRERYPRENKLFHERVASVSARNFMLKEFPFVTPDSTVGEVRNLLSISSSMGPWTTCAFLNNEKERHLWGTISRPVLMEILSTASSELSAVEVDSAAPVSRAPSQRPPFGSTDFGVEELHSLLGVSRSVENSERRASDREGQAIRSEATYGSVGQHSLVFNAGEHERIPFLVEYDPRRGSRLVDMGPMQVSSETPFWKVSTYFRMLGLSSMYVTDNGATVGLLTKARVISFTFCIEDEAAEEKAQREREEREVADLVALTRGPSIGSSRSASQNASKRMASRFSSQDLQQMAASKRGRSQNSSNISRR